MTPNISFLKHISGAIAALMMMAADTCLHRASATGTGADIEKLLDRGASVDTRDQSWRTPSYIAAEKGNLSTLLALLSNWTDPNATDDSGFTPLDSAT